MKNSFSPNNQSCQPDSYQNTDPSEPPFTSSNHHFSNVENSDGDLFNFASHPNEEIIEMTFQIQKNYFPSKLSLEDLKNHKSLDEKMDSFGLRNNDLTEPFIKGKSPTEERQNPNLKEINKEIISQQNHEMDIHSKTLSGNDSENNSAYTEEYDAEGSILTDTEPTTFEDKQTQTSPIIPIQESFPGPLELLQNFSLSPNNIIIQNNELEAKGLQIYFLIHTEPDGSKTFVQPVYFIQSSQILNNLQSAPLENDTGKNMKEFER